MAPSSRLHALWLLVIALRLDGRRVGEESERDTRLRSVDDPSSTLKRSVLRVAARLGWPTLHMGLPDTQTIARSARLRHARLDGLVLRHGRVERIADVVVAYVEGHDGTKPIIAPVSPVDETAVRDLVGHHIEVLAVVLPPRPNGWTGRWLFSIRNESAVGDEPGAWSRDLGIEEPPLRSLR